MQDGVYALTAGCPGRRIGTLERHAVAVLIAAAAVALHFQLHRPFDGR